MWAHLRRAWGHTQADLHASHSHTVCLHGAGWHVSVQLVSGRFFLQPRGVCVDRCVCTSAHAATLAYCIHTAYMQRLAFFTLPLACSKHTTHPGHTFDVYTYCIHIFPHSVLADAARPQQCGFQRQDITRESVCRLCIVQYCVVFGSVELYGLAMWAL